MKTNKEVVLSFINALNEENFDAARKLLNRSFSFEGPLGEREGADVYVNDMKKMKFKYDIDTVFENKNEVCLIYDINMGNGKSIRTCGIYRLEDAKLSSLQVLFDPRPVLEG